MIFSIETIKAANKRKAEYNSKKPIIESSFTDKACNRLLNESVEPFTAPVIDINNYMHCIKAILDSNIDYLNNAFGERVDKINTRFKNWFDDNTIEKIKYILHNIESISADQIGRGSLYYIDHRYAPESYLLIVKRLIYDIRELVDEVCSKYTSDNELNSIYLRYEIACKEDDYSCHFDNPIFLQKFDNDTITSEYILSDNMDFFDTLNYSKILINNSRYITDYLNNLATSLRDLHVIHFSENTSAVIVSKIMSVISYKIKLIAKILDEFKDYTESYICSVLEIIKQNDAIFNYLYNYNNDDRRDIIDANIADPSDTVEESLLFNSLYTAYKEACYNTEQLDLLSESVGLIALDEAGDANIMKYINKVTTSISKAWESFKTKMEDLRKKAVSKFTNKFKQNAEELPDDLQFEVQNMPELDETKFNLIKVIPFNYEEMKDNLKSSDAFIAKYYPNLNRNEGESLKASIEQFLTRGTNNIKITKDYILNSVIPILEKSDSVIEESVKSDVTIMNASTKAISSLHNKNTINTTTTTTTTTNNATNVNNVAPQNSSADVYAILGEADKEGVKIVDDPNRTATADKRSVLKDVSVYLTVSSTVLSAKMKLIRQKELTAFRILAHAFAPVRKKKEEQK